MAPEIAMRYRSLVTNIVVFGVPNGKDGGVRGGIVLLEFKGAGKDLSGDSEVCTWWAKALYTLKREFEDASDMLLGGRRAGLSPAEI